MRNGFLEKSRAEILNLGNRGHRESDWYALLADGEHQDAVWSQHQKPKLKKCLHEL